MYLINLDFNAGKLSVFNHEFTQLKKYFYVTKLFIIKTSENRSKKLRCVRKKTDKV